MVDSDSTFVLCVAAFVMGMVVILLIIRMLPIDAISHQTLDEVCKDKHNLSRYDSKRSHEYYISCVIEIEQPPIIEITRRD